MTEPQFTDQFEAPETDVAEQALPVGEEAQDGRVTAHPEPDVPLEADPADAAEQAVPVPVDEDEYR